MVSKVENEIPLDLFVPMSRRQLENFDPHTFRALCHMAIEEGFTSRQKMTELFCNAIPRRNLDDTWPIPSPATCRKVLEFFMTLPDPTGSRLPWRHAGCARPVAKPEPRDLQRRVAGHPQPSPF
jgi:hypothetical protein